MYNEKKVDDPRITYEIVSLDVHGGTSIKPFASAILKIAGKTEKFADFGDGSTQAVFNTIAKAAKVDLNKFGFSVTQVNDDSPKQSSSSMRFQVEVWSQNNGSRLVGTAICPDINIAAGEAFVFVLNHLACLDMAGG